jgi:ketosteroid isomerase-like protein
MHTDDPVLDLMDRFTAALNSHDLDAVAALVTDDIVFEATSPPPDGTRYEGRDAVRRIWAEMLAATRQARFSVEEQFSAGPGRAVVRWRYDWADGHVRGGYAKHDPAGRDGGNSRNGHRARAVLINTGSSRGCG